MASIRNRFIFILLLLNISSVVFARTSQPPTLTVQQCFKLKAALLTGLAPDPKLAVSHEAKINSLHQEMKGLDYSGIVPWTEKSITKVKRKLALLQIKFFAKELPKYNKAQKLGPAVVNIDEIRFAQINANNVTGEYTVIGNAKAIKEGKLDVSIFPKLRVWRDVDGKIWTLDHRRLVAMRLSGAIDNVEVEFVKKSLVNLHGFKFSTETDGLTIFLRVKEPNDPTKDLIAVIINDQKRLRKPAQNQ